MFTYIISNGKKVKTNSFGSLNIRCINAVTVSNDPKESIKAGNSRKVNVLPHTEVNYRNVSICKEENEKVAK